MTGGCWHLLELGLLLQVGEGLSIDYAMVIAYHVLLNPHFFMLSYFPRAFT